MGKVIKRDNYAAAIERMIDRLKKHETKYSQRKCIVEHPFGTLKRSMNFTYLLLKNFVKVRGEINITFFSYNLKRVIKILGVKGLVEILLKLFSIIFTNDIKIKVS